MLPVMLTSHPALQSAGLDGWPRNSDLQLRLHWCAAVLLLCLGCGGLGWIVGGLALLRLADQGWLMYFLLTPDIGRMIKEYEPVSDYGHQDAAAEQ